MPEHRVFARWAAVAATALALAALALFLILRPRGQPRAAPDITPLRSSLEHAAETALAAPSFLTNVLRRSPDAGDFHAEVERVTAAAARAGATVVKTEKPEETRLLVRMAAGSVAVFFKEVAGAERPSQPVSSDDDPETVEVIIARPRE